MVGVVRDCFRTVVVVVSISVVPRNKATFLVVEGILIFRAKNDIFEGENASQQENVDVTQC